jgi:hypothetical protein
MWNETINKIGNKWIKVTVHQNGSEWRPRVELTPSICWEIQKEMLDKLRSMKEEELFKFLEAFDVIENGGFGTFEDGTTATERNTIFYKEYGFTKIADYICIYVQEVKDLPTKRNYLQDLCDHISRQRDKVSLWKKPESKQEENLANALIALHLYLNDYLDHIGSHVPNYKMKIED